MARLAISKDYFPAYARLPRKAQRKADEFLRKFEQDSTSAALHLEPIKRTLDTQLRSARIGDDYRVILRAPEQGDVFLVLWADHHDEAYRWAVTKQTAVHPATGSLQIFDVTGAAQALTTASPTPEPAPAAPEAALPPALFAAHTDDELFLAGVPRALLPSVRALSSDADLDRLLPHLPPEAGEVLTALAAGISLDDALEEVLGRVAAPTATPAPPAIDVTDVPAALARDTTQRQFRLLADGLDLDAALKHPLDVWRVFLHPRQRRLAFARTKGPTRVLGGAGTGKTVVALHRAAFLVREVFTKPDDRVLFTTFNVNLAHDLRAQLGKLLEPEQLARVEVVNLDAWASSYLRGRGVAVRPAFEKEQRQHFDAAYEVYGVDDVPLDFYRMEWREVIQDQGLRTEDEYVKAVRRSRGVPLPRADRRRLWPVFAAYRDNLEHAGLLEPLDILRRARAALEEAGGPPRYRAVVVDEAQDFAADGLRLLRAIAGPERPDDLFLVGDAHQRIYGRPVALSQCGIQVRGRRSQTLRLNYRTTGAICRWSLAILKDVTVDDLDDGAADRRGYVSLREGPVPDVRGFATALDEESAVVATVQAHLDAGTPAEAICVVARTTGPLRDRLGPALARAGVASVLLEQEEPRLPGIRLATMHRVKGLEFAVVVLAGVSRQDVPYPTPELRSDDPVMAAAALVQERSLLYVAASRARDALHVFHCGAPSPFLLAPAGNAAPAAREPTRVPPSAPAGAVASPPTSPPPARDAVVASAAPARAATPVPLAADPGALQAVLARPLSELHLPTRLANWVHRAGLETLGALARTAPSALLAERNLGRKSIQDARGLIEGMTGRLWEDLVDEAPGDGTLVPGTPDTSTWDGLRRALTDEQRALPLSDLPLAARLVTYATREGLVTLGELADRSRAVLLRAPNLGRATVDALPGVIAGHLRSLDDARSSGAGLLEAFRAALEPLEPMLRIIATRRSGLAGEPVTLQELGDMFGISRERVRQLEAKVCEQLRRQPWAIDARRRVEDAVRDGAVPLLALEQDAWWAGASETPGVVELVVEHVLDVGTHVIELDDAIWLSRHKVGLLHDAFTALLADAQAIAYPVSLGSFEPLIAARGGPFGLRVAAYFRDELHARLQMEEHAPGASGSSGDPRGDARVLAFGDTRQAELLALLRASPVPMHLDEVARQMGGRRRCLLPDEVLHFRRGTIGLRQHFPDFEAWQARLVPDAVRLIERLGPERQWYCGELLDELREEHDIPDWLTAFGLAALIKAEGSLRYLGRLRVALPGSQDAEARVFVHDAVEKLLKDAGEPVLRSELLEKIDQRVGTAGAYGSLVFNRPLFVRVDEDRIGLLSRDVPGGAAAITEAGDHLEAVLARRDRGLSDVHAHDEVVGLSPEHASWSTQLLMSVLRSDGRFRLNQSGAVGLATWESTRVPTRLELVRSALEEAGGRVSVEAVLARIEAHYGVRPSRGALISLAMNVGARVDGDWVIRKVDGA